MEKYTGASEKHINNNLKAIMNFANHIDPNATFFDIKRTEQIIKFLDTKIKTIEEDPDARWITTWNHYLSHIKYFLRRNSLNESFHNNKFPFKVT